MRFISFVLVGLLLVTRVALGQESCATSQLAAGGIGQVTPGAANNVRAEPSASGDLVGQIPGDSVVFVRSDAVCDGSLLWVEVSYGDVTGWTVEANGTDYWIVPREGAFYEDEAVSFVYPEGFFAEITATFIPERDQMGGLYPARWEYELVVEGIRDGDDIIQGYLTALEIEALTERNAPFAHESLQKLEALLAEPIAFTEPILEIAEPGQPRVDSFLPLDPTYLGAQRTLVSSARPVIFQNGSGVAFVTMYSQDLLPVYNDGLFYNMLGLTDRYYVVLRLPITTDRIELDDYFDFPFPPNWEEVYPQHIIDQTLLLDSLAPDEWQPSLTVLADIASSIYVASHPPAADE